MFKYWIRRIYLGSFVLGILGLIVFHHLSFGKTRTVIEFITGVFLSIAVVLFSADVLFHFLRFVNRAYDSALIAAEPIPSPDEIRLGLLEEWGREPSAQEVQITQQSLINRRNEHAVGAALSFGAIYLLGKSR